MFQQVRMIMSSIKFKQGNNRTNEHKSDESSRLEKVYINIKSTLNLIIEKLKNFLKKILPGALKDNMKLPNSGKKNEIKKFFDDVTALSPYLDSSIKNPSTEIKKAAEALKDLQQQVTEKPEILKEELMNHMITTHGLSQEKADKLAIWSNEHAQKYINELAEQDNPQLIRSILISKAPLPSKEEYKKEITKEVVRDLMKEAFIHEKESEEITKKFHNYLHLINETNKMRAEKAPADEIKKIENKTKELWLQMHEIGDPRFEQVFSLIGGGSFGKAELVVQGKAGFLLVKKTIYDNEVPINVEIQTSLDHKNMVTFIPLPNALKDQEKHFAYMTPAGTPISHFYMVIENMDIEERVEEFKAKSDQIDDIFEAIKNALNDDINDISDYLEDIKGASLNFTKTDIQEIIFLLEKLLTETNNKEEAQSLKKWIELSKVWQQEVAPNPEDNQLLDLNDLANISYSFVQGLKYLHDNGIAHYDLHAENVLLDHTKELSFIDFDLCRQSSSGTEPNPDFEKAKCDDMKSMYCHLYFFATGRSVDDNNILGQRASIKEIYPYQHQQKKVDQLDQLLDKIKDVLKGHASLNDVIQMPFFSEIREKSLSLNK